MVACRYQYFSLDCMKQKLLISKCNLFHFHSGFAEFDLKPDWIRCINASVGSYTSVPELIGISAYVAGSVKNIYFNYKIALMYLVRELRMI